MKRVLLAILSLYSLTTGCTNTPSRPIVQAVPRDTSITFANAFTHLLLDSTSVQHFIADRVKDSLTASSLIGFYNSRNYQYAWFNEEGMTEQADALLSLQAMDADSTTTRPPLNQQVRHEMDSILNGDTTQLSHQSLRDAELSLTLYFMQYVDKAVKGKINPDEVKWYIPARKVDPVTALDSFLTGNNGNWRPMGRRYYQLKDKLKAYSTIDAAGGWSILVMKENVLKKGDSSPEIENIKKRLHFTGDLTAFDSTNLFDEPLELSIRKMQVSFGLPVTGSIDRKLIGQLNVPVKERVKQIMINLERMKWMPHEESTYILANIPDYKLRVFDHDTVTMQMRIVVGKAANHTVIFSDKLKYIVFSPYWNLPASIVRNETVPAMKKNKNYLRSHNMEITGYNNGLPVIRQKPGAGNSLGKVKFLFPNRYSIYFHDTPAKDLFDRNERAFSHGCIRLQKPLELAQLLLTDSPQWTEKTIRLAMNDRKEKWVTLKKTVPVYIVYFTSWVDNDGLLHFTDDIYGHDKAMAGHLFK